MSHLKRNLTIVFLCCVTLGICAVGFAQSGEEEDVQGDLDNYKLQIQEDIEAMMECGEDCAGLTIEPPSLEEVIGGKEVDPKEIDDIKKSFESKTGKSTRGGICSRTTTYIYCQNAGGELSQAVVGGKAYGSDYFIVCTSTDLSTWTLAGWAEVDTQTSLYFWGAAQDENIGIIRNDLDLDDDCVFDDFPDYFPSLLEIRGMGGENTVNGSQYDDYLYGQYVLGHEDIDRITLYHVDSITPGAWGGYGGDFIYGTNYDDYVEGNADNDTIWGYNGDDYIHANGGADDICYGGSGTDTCLYCETTTGCP
jgi:hypothetical protein